MKKRSESLDALRGFAILAMVLSGSIAFGNVLPGWMFHAQVPPPDHTFHPDLPGITWVDLVFPFFLFSMGAAFPLALNKKIEQGASKWELTWSIVQRGLLLVFFSLFTMHIRAYVNYDSNTTKWLLAIFSFALVHFMFVQWPAYITKKTALILKIAAFAVGIFILSQLRFKDGTGFSLKRFDIILMVLANMAVFGSVAWVLTRNKPWQRLLILPFIMGVFLSGAVDGSWTKTLFTWTPATGLYSFYYLKYLFIIIPGTIAGEWLMAAANNKTVTHTSFKTEAMILALLSFALVIVNLIGLYGRYLVSNLLISAGIAALCLYLSKRITQKTGNELFVRFTQAGTYLLLLGLVFEAYQGGIKKDISTYSYYFVTSGLAFYVLGGCLLLEAQQAGMKVLSFFAANGKNPMVAYVAGNLVLIPLMALTHTTPWLDSLNTSAWGGFLRGVIFTGIVSLITLWFVRMKWFWKT